MMYCLALGNISYLLTRKNVSSVSHGWRTWAYNILPRSRGVRRKDRSNGSLANPLRGFLGLRSYYRWFVKGYAVIALRVTEQLKKDSFNKNPVAKQAFQSLKVAMTTVPVLSLLNFTKTFVLEKDASTQGVRSVLLLEEHPIALVKFWGRGRVLKIYMRSYWLLCNLSSIGDNT